MSDKSDKYFIISLILLMVSFICPIILIYLLVKYNFEILFAIVFASSVFNYLIIVPILFVTLIIIFIIKIIKKNKKQNDWILLFIYLITMLLLSFILFCFYGFAVIL